MKIKGTYVIREIAGETVVVPTGDEQLSSNVLILLNETGTFMWKLLYDGAEKSDIISAVCNEYEIDTQTVENDFNEFISYLTSRGIDIE